MSWSCSNISNASSWTIKGSPNSLAWPPRPHSPCLNHRARFCSTQIYCQSSLLLMPYPSQHPFPQHPSWEYPNIFFFFSITTQALCLLRYPVFKMLSNNSHFLAFTPSCSLLPHGIGTTCVTHGILWTRWISHSMESHPPCHEDTPVNLWRHLHGEKLRLPTLNQHRLANSVREPLGIGSLGGGGGRETQKKPQKNLQMFGELINSLSLTSRENPS